MKMAQRTTVRFPGAFLEEEVVGIDKGSRQLVKKMLVYHLDALNVQSSRRQISQISFALKVSNFRSHFFCNSFRIETVCSLQFATENVHVRSDPRVAQG